jgi:hypothetical protein
MWSEQTFCEAISAEPTSGTERGEVVYVHWTFEASSSARADSMAGCAFEAGSDGGVEVMLLIIDADLSCDGALLRRASSMPCSVRWERVSVPSTGGVMAMGAIVADLWNVVLERLVVENLCLSLKKAIKGRQ